MRQNPFPGTSEPISAARAPRRLNNRAPAPGTRYNAPSIMEGNMLALCLIITNLLTYPVTIHGCTPLPGATMLECEPDIAPLTITLPPGTWVADDTDQQFESRTWDDPAGVTLHWQTGSCP